MTADLDIPRKVPQHPAFWFVLGGLAGVAAYSWLSSPGPPAGLTPVVAGLTETKAECESLAAAAKGRAGSTAVPAGELANGEALYTRVKIDVDVYVSYLSTGMVAGLTPDDFDKLNARLKQVAENRIRFAKWFSERQKRSGSVESYVPGTLLELAVKLAQHQSTADAHRVEQFRHDLENCRLRNWNEVGR